MARRNRRIPDPQRPLSTGSTRRRERQADGEWVVATWVGRELEQSYICPVCGNRLAATTPHLVVWPEAGTVDDRRHVHTGCWRRRAAQRDPKRW